MKLINLKSAALVLLVTMVSSQLYSQPGPGKQKFDNRERRQECRFHDDSLRCPRGGMMPDLTPEQEKVIKKSKLSFQKEASQLKNQIAEKKARLRTLSTAEKPDQAAIDKIIDEIAALKAQLDKKRSRHQQEIRAVLTDEQKVIFDSKKGGRHKRMMERGDM